ncbi:MAG: hypothetical protein KAG98_01575 [Lentisphaeria bacterium]|nr:hypothetical protein [Lentisphaeria bacterium]
MKNDEYNTAPEMNQGSGEGSSGLKLKTNLGNKELEGMKPCPHCDRMIDEEDRVCMHCGFDLKKGKTVQELNKKLPVSPKLLVTVIVVILLLAAGYLYRQQISEAIDEKAGTNLTEQVNKYAPVDSATGEEGTAVDGKDASDAAKAVKEVTLDEEGNVVEEDAVAVVAKVNPFASLDLEELTYKKEDLVTEVADLKEELKYAKTDYKSMSKDLARAKKGYKSSISKAGKYKAAYQDKNRSRDKRLEYKEQYIQYKEEATGYKEEYSELAKEVKVLKGKIAEPKANLAKKELELEQVNEAIKGKK